jgi:cystathionine beta-lyase
LEKATQTIQHHWHNDSHAAHPPVTVNPPVYRGSTVLFRDYNEMCRAGRGELKSPVYGTDRFPVQRSLEEAIQKLENGAVSRIFPSGLSAIQNTLLAFCQSGDHVLLVDNAYHPGISFCKNILTKFNIETTLIPPAIGADIENYIRENTRLILLESPGSNTFEIQDIPAITDIAVKNNIITAMDNTWATPLYCNPFALGVDISIQSLSKYIAGYSDVLLGAITVNEKYAHILSQYYRHMEMYTPDSDCYLALRGMNTLATRLKQHEQSALKVATLLIDHTLIDTVIHPALPNHPQHKLFLRDFSGSSGLFAFTFKKEYSTDILGTFIDNLKLFGLGYSWGGYKSLLTAGKQERHTTSLYSGKTIIRLNIGLEDPRDLINDLEDGLSVLC